MPCDLCGLAQLVDNGTPEDLRKRAPDGVLYNDPDFFVVYCDNPDHPNTPMAVLKHHQEEINGFQLVYIRNLMARLFPSKKPRGQGMLTIKDHWHEHWVESA